jgi:hypothetical protein
MTSRYDLISTGHRLLCVSLTVIQKSNLETALTKQNTTEYNYYLAHTEHDCTATTCIFNWNTYITGHIQGTVVFPSSAKKKVAKVNRKFRSHRLSSFNKKSQQPIRPHNTPPISWCTWQQVLFTLWWWRTSVTAGVSRLCGATSQRSAGNSFTT